MIIALIKHAPFITFVLLLSVGVAVEDKEIRQNGFPYLDRILNAL